MGFNVEITASDPAIGQSAKYPMDSMTAVATHPRLPDNGYDHWWKFFNLANCLFTPNSCELSQIFALMTSSGQLGSMC
jgi:hypothetical protein